VRDAPRRLALLASLAASACASGPESIDVDDLSDEQLVVEAREKLASGDLDRAEEAADALLERTKDVKRKQEGLFIAGEVHFAQDEKVKAFRHYQELLHDFPWSPFVPKCEEHVFAIGAEQLSGEAWPLFHDLFSGRERGAEVMREFVASYPSSSRADDALAALAGYRYSRKEFEEAARLYGQLASRFPESEWGDLAAFRRAECFKLAARGPGYDPTPLLHAARNYRRYLSDRPTGERRARAQADAREVDEQIAQGELKKAQFYVAREQERGARVHFANVALSFPETSAAEAARRELEKRGWDLSINSVETLSLPPSAERDE